jgi:hypothetical protein
MEEIVAVMKVVYYLAMKKKEQLLIDRDQSSETLKENQCFVIRR